jgi:hypothetical protein
VEFFYADEDEMRNDTLFFVLRSGVPEKVSRLMEKRMKGDKKYAWGGAANGRPPISSQWGFVGSLLAVI